MAIGTKGFDQFFSKRCNCLISIIAHAMGFPLTSIAWNLIFLFRVHGKGNFFN